MVEFKTEGASVTFWLRVKPRASRDRLKCGPQGELILEVHAPPVEGEANQACLNFLAQAVRVPKSSVSLLAGEKSRRKLIRISSRSGKETAEQIMALAQENTVRRRD